MATSLASALLIGTLTLLQPCYCIDLSTVSGRKTVSEVTKLPLRRNHCLSQLYPVD